MSHQWHFWLSVFTCGLWIPIWIISGVIGLIPESDTTKVTKVSEEYEACDLNNIAITVSVKSSGDHSESTAKSWDFDSISPDDYQNYSSYRDEVAGVQYLIEEAKRFAEGTEQSLEFEREPNNAHDQNAIKIVGLFRENGRACRVHLGYVDHSNAESIANDQVYDFVKPVLKQIWWGGYVRDFIVIRYQSIILSTKMSDVKAKRKAANPPKKKPAKKTPTKRKKKDI